MVDSPGVEFEKHHRDGQVCAVAEIYQRLNNHHYDFCAVAADSGELDVYADALTAHMRTREEAERQ